MGGGPKGDLPNSRNKPTLNQWEHFAFTLDLNGNFVWYINGVITSSGQFTNTLNYFADFRIGSDNNNTGSSDNWIGEMDDFGVWAKVLDSNEVMNLYKGCNLTILEEPSDFKSSLDEAVFTTKVSDTSALFQWQLYDGTGWKNIQENNQNVGVQTDTLRILNLTILNENQLYRCIVTGTCMTDTTRVAQLTICNRIVNQPKDTGCFNGDVSFSVLMYDTNAEYQWQTNQGMGWVDLSNAGQYSNTSNNTLIVKNTSIANDEQLFRCVIKGNCKLDTTRVAKIDIWGVDTEFIEIGEVYISPNPVSDILNLNGINTPIKFYIIDLFGKQLLSGTVTDNGIDIRSFKPVIYLLNLNNKSIRFVKE